MREEEAYGVTCPLLLDSTGKKFGKSEGNALRLNATKTTPYAMYQYFLNTADEDIARFLKILTLLSLEEIDAIVATHDEAPHHRFGQKKLAEYVITTIFGAAAAKQATQISELCFGQCDVLEMISQKMDEETKKALREAT
jgi:tyrosyl-tRNA synthetase